MTHAILQAATFAAEKHADQRRKGKRQEPYINHLLEVAELVSSVAERDENLIIAALLHDVVEDAGVTFAELAERFSDDVAALVAEVTDDKSLPKVERKRLQIVSAPHKSPRARILKLADKISNLRSMLNSCRLERGPQARVLRLGQPGSRRPDRAQPATQARVRSACPRVRRGAGACLMFSAQQGDGPRVHPLRRRNTIGEMLLGRALFLRRSARLCVLVEKAGEEFLKRVLVRCVNEVAILSQMHILKGALVLLGVSGLMAQNAPPNSPFVPSTTPAVETMLKMAGVTRQDVVYDLGCGDGRIVIAAAKTYGAHGVGMDIDPKLIQQARAAAKKAHVEKLVRFEVADLFKADIHDATVVTVFLLRETNKLLRPKLLAELKPGTRVVANTFDFGDWKPDKKITFPSVNPEEYLSTEFFLWTVPERATSRP